MICAYAVIIRVKKTWFETPPAPTDACRAPNPKVLSTLQFVSVYATINQLCSIDKAPLKPCLVFSFPIN